MAWLNNNQFSMYQDNLEQHGVFTFESFHRLIRDEKGLLDIIGSHNEYDAHLMWSSTPREKRRLLHKQQQQMEGLRIN